MIVSVTTTSADPERRDRQRARSESISSMTIEPITSRRCAATPSAEASPPSSLSRRSAGPFNARPPMIGDTATTLARRCPKYLIGRCPETAEDRTTIQTRSDSTSATTIPALPSRSCLEHARTRKRRLEHHQMRTLPTATASSRVALRSTPGNRSRRHRRASAPTFAPVDRSSATRWRTEAPHATSDLSGPRCESGAPSRRRIER